jgi:hypothetical protein
MRRFKAVPEREREAYRFFSWPETMQAGLLPWQAAHMILDLARFKLDHNMAPPLVVEAQWFWRITLAIPGTPLATRANLTKIAALSEMSGQPQTELWDVVEAMLIYQPWRSDADRKAYLQAAQEGRIATTFPRPVSVSLEHALPLVGHYYSTPEAEIITV